MPQIKVIITGATGKMGKALVQAILSTPPYTTQFKLIGVTVIQNAPELNQDIGPLVGLPPTGILCTDSLASIINDCDIVIDFTEKSASIQHATVCRDAGKKILIGTTGITSIQQEDLKKLSQSIPIILAPNTSIGVNLCYALLKKAAEVIGNDADIHILDAHHHHKKDAPSGTALKMGEVIESALKSQNTPSQLTKKIEYSAIRAGDIIGDHTVLFAIEGERVEITHKATNRLLFVKGALRGAEWLMQCDRAGLYSMQDVLRLNK